MRHVDRRFNGAREHRGESVGERGEGGGARGREK